MRTRYPGLTWGLVGTTAGALVLAAFGAAPVPLPDSESPWLAMPGPMGIQRGTALDLVLTGDRLAQPTGLWTSFPARTAIPFDHGNGTDERSLRVRIEVPADAPLGFHAIRLATRRGLSNLRLFCVDDLPQITAAGNHSRVGSPLLPVPCVAAGRIDPETADYYRVAVRAGQRVTFEVLGRRLGSGLDPQIALYDRYGQRELAGGYSNDTPGLQSDARLTYTFRRAGEYLVQIRDTRWSGGPDFWYRLRVGDFPCATTPIPMAARRGTRVQVRFAGPRVDDVPPVEVHVPSDPGVQAVWVTPRGVNGLAGWPVLLALSELPECVEQEPNDTALRANRVPMPGGLTGRFQHPGDVDYFVFRARQGRRYVIDAQDHEWSSPCDVRLGLSNASGAEVAQSDPQLPSPLDQRLAFEAAADGDYILSVEHLLGNGGPSETYHLTLREDVPTFELGLTADRLDLPADGFAAVRVAAQRRGYSGPIELTTVATMPGLVGTGTIPAGATEACLFIHACPDVPEGPYALRVVGKAAGQMRVASIRSALRQELAGLAYPPRTLAAHVGVAVTADAPFHLRATLGQAEVLRGGHADVRVEIQRRPEFREGILLSGYAMPPGVHAVLGPAAPAERAVVGQLRLAPATPLGCFAVSILGQAMCHGRAYHVAAPPTALSVVRPFDLWIEPSPTVLAPGGRMRLRVMARRRGGYGGSIALVVRGLPPGVTASKATIPEGQNRAEIELAAAATTALSHAPIRVAGTITDPPGQGNVSPACLLSIQGR